MIERMDAACVALLPSLLEELLDSAQELPNTYTNIIRR
jgi:ABC-type transporter Mla MlaB component